ncbi:MAG: hypothetical protein ACRCXT_09840 [Paraclostridium sp.]
MVKKDLKYFMNEFDKIEKEYADCKDANCENHSCSHCSFVAFKLALHADTILGLIEQAKRNKGGK